jgi:hypothetical protein
MLKVERLSTYFGQPKNTFRVGFEYQLWNNKFGNTEHTVGASGGNRAARRWCGPSTTSRSSFRYLMHVVPAEAGTPVGQRLYGARRTWVSYFRPGLFLVNKLSNKQSITA